MSKAVTRTYNQHRSKAGLIELWRTQASVPLTATNVAGRKRIVMRAIVFIAELSRLLDIAMMALSAARDRLILFSSWAIKLNVF